MGYDIIGSLTVSLFASCCCDKNTVAKKWGGKSSFGFTLPGSSHDQGNSGQELHQEPEAGTEVASREKHSFRLAELYCSEIPAMVTQLAPYTPWDHLPRGSTTHSEVGPSTSVTTTGLLQANLVRTVRPVW